MSNELAVKIKGLSDLLSTNIKSIKSLLPNGMDEKRLCRMAINAVIKNPALAGCKPATFLMAVMNAAEMGLEPTLGQCAFIPYKGVVQCQPMYQGLIHLARNSGKISLIYAQVVREDDKFEYELGLNPKLVHVPVPDSSKPLVYAYAVAKMTDGSSQFVVLSQSQIEKRKKTSKNTGEDSIWVNWQEEMWMKTAIKALYKLLPKSAEMAKALVVDNDAEVGKPTPPSVEVNDFKDLPLDEMIGEPEGEGTIAPPQAKKDSAKQSEDLKLEGQKAK